MRQGVRRAAQGALKRFHTTTPTAGHQKPLSRHTRTRQHIHMRTLLAEHLDDLLISCRLFGLPPQQMLVAGDFIHITKFLFYSRLKIAIFIAH